MRSPARVLAISRQNARGQDLGVTPGSKRKEKTLRYRIRELYSRQSEGYEPQQSLSIPFNPFQSVSIGLFGKVWASTPGSKRKEKTLRYRIREF